MAFQQLTNCKLLCRYHVYFKAPFRHVFEKQLSSTNVNKQSPDYSYSHDSVNVSDGPVHLYNIKVKEGELKEDSHQRHIIESLQSLHDVIKDYRPSPPSQDGFFTKLFRPKSKTPVREDAAIKYTDSPPGLYLYGSVGTGKTMLMDFFYETCPIERKQRVHFHQFMLDVHKRLHKVKKEMAPKNYNLNRAVPYDPIPPVARDIGQQSWLLCFDEFQITDIADAMILKRLFSHLWQNGVVVVATSNRHPEDLYKNGLQRIHFLPFIPMLKQNNDVLCLDSGVDYRMQSIPAEGTIYFVEGECDTKYEMDRTYEDLVSRESGTEGPRTLTVLSREIHFPRTCGRILDCTFKELCMQPLGAVDYLELVNEFDTILLRDIPRLTLEQRNEARRFIILIDTLYDHKIRLVCSAQAKPQQLFAVGKLSEWDRHHKRILIGDLDIKKGDENEGASLFSGEEELFAFERVISRLTEMQTENYWKLREVLKTSGNRTARAL